MTANVSNTVGLAPGSLSGAIGYRRELAGQGRRMAWLGGASALGGLAGGLLLLALPATSFELVVPWLILAAVALIALQPALSAWVQSHRGGRGHAIPLFASVTLSGVYGGYFGAAQGVILIALLGTFLPDDLQRLNGLKNVLAFVVNLVAAVLFIVIAPVAWPAAILLAIGAVVGGQLGAVLGRRLPASVLRGVIMVVGTLVAIRLLVG